MFLCSDGGCVESGLAARVLQTRSDISYVKLASDDVGKYGLGVLVAMTNEKVDAKMVRPS